MPASARAVKSKSNPQNDPRFKRVIEKLNTDSKKLKQHPPAAKKAAEPAKAAKPPANEKAAGARAKQVDKLDQAETKKPETSSFLALLQAEIAKAMPKTLGDTEKFMKGGSSEQMKGSLKGNVAQQKQEATGDMKKTSNEAPSESGVPAKPVTPIAPEPGAPAPQVDAAGAMPAPKPDAEVSLQASKSEVQGELQKEKLTDERLKKANDPRFSAVLTAKDSVAKQADAGPAKYRAKETGTLAQTAAKAVDVTRKGAATLLGVKGGNKAKVLSRQEQQKAKEEVELKSFTDFVVATFAQTKQTVDNRLELLETKVNELFDKGVEAALSAMKSFVEDQLFQYKLKRYLSIPLVGLALWIKDQILNLPEEANRFYEAGRAQFTAAMNALAVRVANLVESQLAAAKNDVKVGQAKIAAKAATLSPGVKTRAAQVQAEYAGKFAELESGIEDKKQQLAESLAQKYKEAFDKADEALKSIQDENKGLVDKAKEKIGEVLKALSEFKDRLMGILRKGADTIDLILKDPIQFLSNLIAAIKAGFNQFVGNIWTHLKAGFMKWLFGSLAKAGIEIPADLSLPSILKLVLGVLGITYERMRAKAVKLIGEKAVGAIEKVVEYITVLVKGGPAALWEKVKEDLSSLKEMVIDAIQDWIITTIVKKAVAKIVSMFNPAGAIIQAILMIYDVVTFIIDKASQIMDFVEAVVNSISAIATGAIGGAASWIEKSLANMVPILIGFLANLLGLGGISEKIREFIKKVQDKVDKAIDKAIAKIVAVVKKLFGKISGKGDSEEDKKKRLDEASKAALSAVSRFAGKRVGAIILKPLLAVIKLRYRLTSLEPVQAGEYWSIRATINPITVTQTKVKVGEDKPEAEVKIEYEPEWPLDEFNSKANAIKSATEKKTADKAMTLALDPKTKKQKSTKPLRKGGQDRFRSEIHAFIDSIPEAADRTTPKTLMTKLQADHQQELQMSGTDTPENMAMIEQRMNSQMGAKFRAGLKNLQPETVITKVDIEKGAAKPGKHRETGTARQLQDLLLALRTKHAIVLKTTVKTIKDWFRLD
jgi:hypothetical protein